MLAVIVLLLLQGTCVAEWHSHGTWDTEITALHVDASGQVWTGTHEGETRVYTGGVWEAVPSDLQAPIAGLADGPGGDLWLGSVDAKGVGRLVGVEWEYWEGTLLTVVGKCVADSGLACYRWAGDAFPDPRIYRGIPYLNANGITRFSANAGALYVAYNVPTPSAVVEYDGAQVRCWPGDPALEPFPLALDAAPGGDVWVAFFGGLAVKRSGADSWHRMDPPSGLHVSPVWSVLGKGDGVAIAGTNAGAFLVSEGSWECLLDGTPVEALARGVGAVWALCTGNEPAVVPLGVDTGETVRTPPGVDLTDAHIAIADDGVLWLAASRQVWNWVPSSTGVRTAAWGGVKSTRRALSRACARPAPWTEPPWLSRDWVR